jgi:MIP family channel proteins
LLVFFITSVVVLFVSTGSQAQFGSDFAVVGLVHAFLLFGLVVMFGVASGGHFNPAVTLAAAAIKRIPPMDAVIYMLAQLCGGVLGALLCKGLLLDEGRAVNWGAADVSPLLGSDFAGMICEGIGALLIALGVVAVAMNKRARPEWGPLTVGLTFAFCVMIFGPLTGGSFNPARWFGPALVSNEWGGVWPYVVGPLLGALIAVALYKFVISAGEGEPELEKATGPSTGTTPRPQK